MPVNLFDALTAKRSDQHDRQSGAASWVPLSSILLPLLLPGGLCSCCSPGCRRAAGWASASASRRPSNSIQDMPKTTFADVAGVDEAVEELYEIKDFLQNPARAIRRSARRSPKGVLLVRAAGHR